MAYETTVKNAVRAALQDLINPTPFHKESVFCQYITGAARVICPGGELEDLPVGAAGVKITGSEVAANTTLTSKTADGKSGVISNNFTGSSTVTVNLDAAVSLGDTSITVAALGTAIPAGTILTFVDTTAKEVVVSADAAAAATSISIYASQYAITDNTNALYHDGSINLYPIIGTGDASETDFTVTITLPTNHAIQPGSVEIFDGDTIGGATEVFTDDGNGVLTGDAGGTGTINYKTGAISVSFNAAPSNGTEILAKFHTGLFTKNKYSSGQNQLFRENDIVMTYQEGDTETPYVIAVKILKQGKNLQTN